MKRIQERIVNEVGGVHGVRNRRKCFKVGVVGCDEYTKRASKNEMKRYCLICVEMAASVVWGKRNQRARLHDDRVY